eukprot:6178062-Pleurochrysis_carterae.AAC.1
MMPLCLPCFKCGLFTILDGVCRFPCVAGNSRIRIVVSSVTLRKLAVRSAASHACTPNPDTAQNKC